MNEETLLKVKALMESEEFGKEIENVETAEELKDIIKSHGIEITVEEVEELCVGIASKNKNVLDEQDLDSVTGGFAMTTLAVYGGTMLVSYGVGFVAAKIFKKKFGKYL